MARFIAVQPIHFGGALAFAPGHQVPADHVERFGYLDAGWVTEVPDEHRGDAPHLVPAAADNAPPISPLAARYIDEVAERVEQAQRDFATAQQPPAGELAQNVDGEPDPETAETSSTAKPARAKKPQPATGDTTTSTVTED